MLYKTRGITIEHGPSVASAPTHPGPSLGKNSHHANLSPQRLAACGQTMISLRNNERQLPQRNLRSSLDLLAALCLRLTLAHLRPVTPETTLPSYTNGLAELVSVLLDFHRILGTQHQQLEEHLRSILPARSSFGAEISEQRLVLCALARRRWVGGVGWVVGRKVISQ